MISALFVDAGFRDLALVDIRSASSRFYRMSFRVDLPECSRLTARRRSKAWFHASGTGLPSACLAGIVG